MLCKYRDRQALYELTRKVGKSNTPPVCIGLKGRQKPVRRMGLIMLHNSLCWLGLRDEPLPYCLQQTLSQTFRRQARCTLYAQCSQGHLWRKDTEKDKRFSTCNGWEGCTSTTGMRLSGTYSTSNDASRKHTAMRCRTPKMRSRARSHMGNAPVAAPPCMSSPKANSLPAPVL